MFLRGVGGGVIWVFSTQLLLQLTPDRVRGRIFSTEFAIFSLANAVGSIVVGWALDNTSFGLSTVMWWMAILSAIAGVLWLYHSAHSDPGFDTA
jgi:predicted MFS family arabinose efflux permease